MITTNTDGNPISQAFADAMAGDSVSYSMRLYRNGSDLGAVIKRAQLDLGAGSTSDDFGSFQACGVYQTQFSASLYECPDVIGDELEVRVGVDVGGSYEYVAVAYVTITEHAQWKGVSEVRGVGRMGLMHAPHGLAEGDYSPSSICAAVLAATGITVAVDSRLVSQDVHVDAGGTCRDAVESMCTRLGGYACELGQGVYVMPYSSTATGTLPAGHVTGRPELGAAYEVDGITVDAGQSSYVQGTGRVHLADLTATAATASATWGNMRGYAFTPAVLQVALIDPRWTVADTLSLAFGDDSYSIPARGISITYDGGYFGTISASGLTAEAEASMVAGPLERKADAAYGIADEALAVAQATGQYFWHDSNGAHVSTEALNPTGPSNSLWNSLGLLIRKAANNLVSITQSAIAFYDGLGNAASNIVASFGTNGFQIGQDGDAHLVGDYRSLRMYDRDGEQFLDIRDMRDSTGYAAVSDSFVGDGTDRRFNLTYSNGTTGHSVTIGGSAVTSGWAIERIGSTDYAVFDAAPAAGADIRVGYLTPSGNAKSFTLGNRAQGTDEGPMSVAEGDGVEASGSHSHAEGMGTAARGTYSHAEGCMTEAAGIYSHAEGYGTVADGSSQHVSGRYNVADTAGSYAEIVGNGRGGARSNARTLDWSGNEWLAGDIDVGGTVRVGGADIYGLSSTSTAADIVSPSTGFTVNSASYAARGGVAMLSVSVKGFAASTGTQTVGTVVSGKRPAIRAYGGFNNDRSAYCRVGTDGAIEVSWKTAPSATASYVFQFTYILA